jgi:hypothetical protein
VNKLIPIFIIAMIFLSIYSISVSRVYGSTSETDWNEICLLVKPVLYKSCNVYVDNNGDLTAQGEKAFDCIRNGALLAGGAAVFIPELIPFIKQGLDFLDDRTGCGGIVNFDKFDLLDLPLIGDILSNVLG